MPFWPQLLISQSVDGAALTASTTPTSILHATGKYTFLANEFQVGSVLRLKAHGRVSNIVTTPGTLTLDLRGQGIVVANGGAMALNIVAKTNVPWVLEWVLECRSVGSITAATFFHQGTWASESVIAAPVPGTGGVPMHMLPNATPAVGTGWDSTAAFTLDLFATWSLNNANSITVHGMQLFGDNIPPR